MFTQNSGIRSHLRINETLVFMSPNNEVQKARQKVLIDCIFRVRLDSAKHSKKKNHLLISAQHTNFKCSINSSIHSQARKHNLF